MPAAITRAQADGHARGDRPAPSIEIFSGVGFTQNSVFGYGGAVWAFGASVDARGPRVKALTGIGAYEYSGALPGVAGSAGFDGDVALAQLLGGYQWRRGEWTLKAYAGVGFETHDLSPGDPDNSVNGGEFGAVGQIELWRNLGDAGWLSLDASYADVFASYWTQLRLGRRMRGRVSAGLETGLSGNEEYDSARAGGFLRYNLGGTELTLSGGVSGDYLAEDFGGYAAFGLYRKF
ncbi:MAG TPA: cellulose biosynthesis protein BcsS [Rhizobiales bacterium]|nr:cellulose biosynthesis protein BcsS [Hyphomicrobiales bacterium]